MCSGWWITNLYVLLVCSHDMLRSAVKRSIWVVATHSRLDILVAYALTTMKQHFILLAFICALLMVCDARHDFQMSFPGADGALAAKPVEWADCGE